MSELSAFLLPPATALVGMRLAALILGGKFKQEFGFGLRFAIGLAFGMVVFTQAVLFFAMAGINASFVLAWLALFWGLLEFALVLVKVPAQLKRVQFLPPHLWLILLIPLVYSWYVFGRLSTLEGTMEFDANAFWVFKSKILYLKQGADLVHILRDINFGYAHMDYPMLVPCLYTLNYGLVGRVDEFVNKVWPFWMMVGLCSGIISAARFWKQPCLLPVAVVTLIAFLPASLEFIRNEGGTIPMVFYTCLAVLLIVAAVYAGYEIAPAALVLVLAGCFSTKFEGVLFTAFTGCALAAVAVRRGWLKNRVLWKSAAAAAICIVPYIIYRLLKPISNVESAWLHTGMATPGAVLHRFPQIWFLDIFARFFNPALFQWQANNNHLQWIGHWTGWSSLVNDKLTVLPWLVVALLIVTFVFKSRSRLVIGLLSAIILVLFTFLSFVVSCLKKDDLQSGIDFACNVVGRYYDPFFTAWFLGIAAVWFMNDKPPAAARAGVEPEKTVAGLARPAKRNR